ncbi:LysR family transcriptional regulator [Corynebacterium halotolerans]|uniref:LysR family transcriptional regulator n=1 Tax=Corynebacterium halotolerans TaxID=225326 RepID=UPI003CF8ED18
MAAKIETAHLEGLITFLAVARLGRYTSAAKSLGINHSTVSRRVADLEKALGGQVLERGASGWELTELGNRAMPAAERAERTLQELGALADGGDALRLSGVVRIAAPDAFTTFIAIPALAKLQIQEPGLGIDILTATQQLRQRRSGADIEIVIGEPRVNKAVTVELLSYRLRLYAAQDYLDREGTPGSLDDLARHRLNYYIDSVLQVDDLDSGARRIPSYQPGISSTSVFAHVASTVAGAGLGLLPEFAVEDGSLVPVLPTEFHHEVSYWAVMREENARNASVRACMAALREESRAERFQFAEFN